ncbi:uncharacterized protein LOC142640006 [Castanea sativa]|uniref:uncharacterized protein LOC142640006 n=1 Tax=Castanea sativa TaxID=21020 RepID=UPI003F64FAE8
MATQDVVQKGLRWQVGNGRSIGIWKDKWLPTPFSYKVTSLLSTFHEDAQVVELIDSNSGTWKHDILNQVFLPHEAEIIDGIALSSNPQEDKQIWAPTISGLFNVRSDYWFAMEEVPKGGTASASNDSNQRKFWKYLCSMNIPHKSASFCVESMQRHTAYKRKTQKEEGYVG